LSIPAASLYEAARAGKQDFVFTIPRLRAEWRLWGMGRLSAKQNGMTAEAPRAADR
jgi:hypothetical protein